MAATIGVNKDKEAQADQSGDEDPGRAALKKSISPPLEAQAQHDPVGAGLDPSHEDPTHRDTPPVAILAIAPATSAAAAPAAEERPTSPKDKDHGKVSSWLKSKFGSRGGHKLTKSDASAIKPLRPSDKPAPTSEKPAPTSDKPAPPSDRPKTSTESHSGSAAEPSVAAADFAAPDVSDLSPGALEPKAVLTEPHSDPVPIIALAAPTDGASGTGTGVASSGVSPISPVETDAASAREKFADADAAAPAPAPAPARHPLAVATAAAVDQNSSERDVALAGRADADAGPVPAPARRRSRSTSISSLSSDEPAMASASAPAPAPIVAAGARGRAGVGEPGQRLSVAAGSSVGDEFEEARDRFEEGSLPVPPPMTAAGLGKGRMDSPARETRFREEL